MPTGVVLFETKHGSDDENRTCALLQGLVDEFVLSRYTFTTRVRVDEKAVPHSHPVLTMSTRFMVRTRDGALADYLHEQLHWFAVQHKAQTRRADRVWRTKFGPVPRAKGGGAKTRRSTRLHLTVNWFEFAALVDVIGRERATAVIEAKAAGHVYPWVYRKVLDEHDAIAAVLREAGFSFDAA